MNQIENFQKSLTGMCYDQGFSVPMPFLKLSSPRRTLY